MGVPHNTTILAGDIGGTKTNLGIFTQEDNIPVLQRFATYASKEYSGLEELIEDFLSGENSRVEYGCFGVAGPVLDGQVKTTNLPWLIKDVALKKQFGLSDVALVNDLVATALSIPVLAEDDLYSLTTHQSLIGHPRALMSPGTGLGMSLIPYIDGRYRPQPSEGGHVDFGPKNDEHVHLYKFLRKRFGHVSCERLVSGMGLVNIYSWLKESGFSREPDWLSEQLENSDPPKVISENGMAARDVQCEKALDLFVSIMGSAAGNLALAGMATGGLYLGGGIVPQILEKLTEGRFIDSFVDKGRYRGLLKKVPVKVIVNRRAPLLGAAHHGFELAGSDRD